MRFSSQSGTDASLGVLLVRNLVDHLSDGDRARVAQSAERAYGDVRAGRDGWLVVSVYQWETQSVLLKRQDDGRLLYQCSCMTYREQAPNPCSHVPIAVVMAMESDATDEQGALTAKAARLPQA